MLRVTLEATDATGHMKRIGVIEIVNDRRGTREVGHYNCRYTNEESLEMYFARVEDHIRAHGPLLLVRKVVEALESNPKLTIDEMKEAVRQYEERMDAQNRMGSGERVAALPAREETKFRQGSEGSVYRGTGEDGGEAQGNERADFSGGQPLPSRGVAYRDLRPGGE